MQIVLNGLVFGALETGWRQPAAGLPLAGTVPLFRLALGLAAGLFGVWLWAWRSGETRSVTRAELQRQLLAVDADEIAAEIFARYGAGNYLRPRTEVFGLSDLPLRRRLASVLGRVETGPATGEPVIYLPDSLLQAQSGSAWRQSLLSLLLEYHLRRYYDRQRRELARARPSVRHGPLARWMHAAWRTADAYGYVRHYLAGDSSSLAASLRQAGPDSAGVLARAYGAWLRAPNRENTRALSAAWVREIRTAPDPAASLATVSELCRRIPALSGQPAFVWTRPPAGVQHEEILLPGVMFEPQNRELLRTLKNVLRALPVNTDWRPRFQPLPRPRRLSAQAA